MTSLEREIIRWGKLVFERRLISGWGGNLSCRAGNKGFLITGQHAPLGFLTAKDLVRVDRQGKPFQKKQRASSETPMHMAVYAGTEAQVIVHVHPPMVLSFSLTHDCFTPLSFEEKYTIGEVPIIAQDTPTVTRPQRVVEELRYHPVVIIKGHGTVAIGKNFQEAFLFTDLLEEAVHSQYFKEKVTDSASPACNAGAESKPDVSARAERYALFSREHMAALVERANGDAQFRADGKETGLTSSLSLLLEERKAVWTVRFVDGEITQLAPGDGGEFLIGGKEEWWSAVFHARVDPFLATQQGKLKLMRGELAQLSRWYKPFQRAFTLWQTIPIR